MVSGYEVVWQYTEVWCSMMGGKKYSVTVECSSMKYCDGESEAWSTVTKWGMKYSDGKCGMKYWVMGEWSMKYSDGKSEAWSTVWREEWSMEYSVTVIVKH